MGKMFEIIRITKNRIKSYKTSIKSYKIRIAKYGVFFREKCDNVLTNIRYQKRARKLGGQNESKGIFRK